MRRALQISGKFLVSLVLTTIICTAAWEAVNDRLYDCTDAYGFDYWQPGNWVHGGVAVASRLFGMLSIIVP